MARNLTVGETVYVPRSKLGMALDGASAFWRGSVAQVQDRSITVTLPGGNTSARVATSAVHRNVGVLVFRIGDFDTEAGLLDPLAKSVQHFLRLLLPDDMTRTCYVRSTDEIQSIWQANHGAYSHVALIGHGRHDAIKFGIGGWIDAPSLAQIFAVAASDAKNYISLCCNSGYRDFAGAFSTDPICASLLAPFHDVHGAVASQYLQTFLAYHLLHGETVRVAHRHARDSVPGGVSFRLWQNGKLG